MNYYKITAVNNQTLLYVCNSETKRSKLISTSEGLPLMDMSFVIIGDDIHQLYKAKEHIFGICKEPVKGSFMLKVIIDDYLNTEFVLTGAEETLSISTYRKGQKQGVAKKLTVPSLYYKGTIRFKLDCNESPYNDTKPLSYAEVCIINMVIN